MNPEKSIVINGRICPYRDDETVLDVARRNGIYIPTLCHLAGTTNTGACRVCVVEVEGVRNLVASCAMPAMHNMVVFTDSPRVIEARRFIIALLLISGNHNCAARGAANGDWTDFQAVVREDDGSGELCDAYGACMLQELAYRYQAFELMTDLRLPGLRSEHAVEDANPFIVRDFSRCVLCGRCVKACNEIQVNRAIAHGYRGMEAKIVTRGDGTLAGSDCVFCGECVQACPVGALVEKEVRFGTRFWSLARVPSTCGLCSTGCAVNIYTKNNAVVRIEGDPSGAVNGGSLCAKGRYAFGFTGIKGRVTDPMVRKGASLEAAGWEEALGMIAGSLARIVKEHGPDAVAGVASARCINEDLYAMQRFFRAVIGTNNIDSTAGLLDGPAFRALRESPGVSAMTNTVGDIDASDCILVAGCDATASHPVIASRIKRAATVRGVPLIVADPGETALARHAAWHLRPEPGTDAAWIYGFINVIIKEGLADLDAAAKSFERFNALHKAVADYTPERVEQITGIPAELLVDAARAYGGATRASAFYASGLTQHGAGITNVRALADLAMLCGNLGVAGGGINPLLGEANSQGACDMGCLPDQLPGHRGTGDEDARSVFGASWGTTPPAAGGKNIMEMIRAIEEGSLRALVLLGVDLPAFLPDPGRIEKALGRLDLLVVHEMMMTGSASMAHVLLPAMSPAECEGTLTSTDRMVRLVHKAIEPGAGRREGWRLFAGLSRVMGHDTGHDSAEKVFEEIARLVPAYGDMSYPQIEERGGLRWRFGAKGKPRRRSRKPPALRAPGEGDEGEIFKPGAATGRRPSFHAVEIRLPDRGGMPFTLVPTGIMKEYHHYTGDLAAFAETSAAMNPGDAVKTGIGDGDAARITSAAGSIELRVMLDPGVREGVISLPFHGTGKRIGELIAPVPDPESGMPAYKSSGVRVEKVGG